MGHRHVRITVHSTSPSWCQENSASVFCHIFNCNCLTSFMYVQKRRPHCNSLRMNSFLKRIFRAPEATILPIGVYVKGKMDLVTKDDFSPLDKTLKSKLPLFVTVNFWESPSAD